MRALGAGFLTEAFRSFGSIAATNSVTRIVRLEECPGGSTGQKFFLAVEYAQPAPDLHTDLFVKFSRDFTNPLRDRGRYEMEAEVRFAPLSRLPGFPIRVPVAYFADYEHESGTGLLITQQIAFGVDGIEPHQPKCLDHDLEDPLARYRAIVAALAQLAATHKSARLSAEVEARFPFDAQAAAASDPIRHDGPRLRELIRGYAQFAATYPQLVPSSLTPAFFARMEREVGRFLQHETTIKRFLQSDRDFIALCHWNANIDNAWFWRDASGTMQCGLMDWGRVRQMNVAYALWGALSAAHQELWDEHFDELLDLFVTELRANGGPSLATADLRLHMDLYVATMGLAWLMEAPAKVLSRLPAAATASSQRDPVFRTSEAARAQLHISTMFLHLWQTHDFAAGLDRVLAGIGEGGGPQKTA
ncbi:MAG TPA: hypothetical protein PKE27_19390 [Povalibacter sp.]|uniref:hypothetical protein n=1 Tax=Povalibacter sp. TaxID=1962978 RepID=UPI002C9B54E9|nr:hypothetical protein [Povalibacter sp.]HMN46750.1 hypothetical protein [Povalibacter sp.]